MMNFFFESLDPCEFVCESFEISGELYSKPLNPT